MKNLLSRFVDTNEREVRRLRPIVDEINALEPELQALSDDESARAWSRCATRCARGRAPDRAVRGGARSRRLRARAGAAPRQRRKDDVKRLQEALDDALPEVFAAAREVSRRQARHAAASTSS